MKSGGTTSVKASKPKVEYSFRVLSLKEKTESKLTLTLCIPS